MEPLVSVIIPTYNNYVGLLKSLESINSQTYKNIEILIVNDGSTDPEYSNLIENENTRIINMKENSVIKNKYFSDSIRNEGIKESNGKYIAFLDDDDYWLETKLQSQIDILENSHYLMSCSDAFASFGQYGKNENYDLFNQKLNFEEIAKIYKKSKLKGRFVKNLIYNFEFPNIFDFKFISIHNCIITSSVVVDKELLNKVGNFRDIQSKKLWSDWDCWLGILTHTDCVYFKEPLLHYDMTPGMNLNPS